MSVRVHVNKDGSVHGTLKNGGMLLKLCMDPEHTNVPELKRRIDILDDGGTFVFPFVHKNRDMLLRLERNDEDGRYDLALTIKLSASAEVGDDLVGMLKGMSEVCPDVTSRPTLQDVTSQSKLMEYK